MLLETTLKHQRERIRFNLWEMEISWTIAVCQIILEWDKISNFYVNDFFTQNLAELLPTSDALLSQFGEQDTIPQSSHEDIDLDSRFFFINHSRRTEVINSVKIVGLQVVMQFHIAVKSSTKVAFKGYLQSLLFRAFVPVVTTRNSRILDSEERKGASELSETSYCVKHPQKCLPKYSPIISSHGSFSHDFSGGGRTRCFGVGDNSHPSLLPTL